LIRSALFFASLLVLVSCRPDAVEKMATATKLMDASYSVAYAEGAEDCRRAANDWAEYDACVSPWEAAAQALGIVHDTALALDTVGGGRSFKAASCAWLRSVAVFDGLSPVDIPVAKMILAGKLSSKC
jgi:hypothetical protein